MKENSNSSAMQKKKRQAVYGGLYAVCTDLFDDKAADILKVSERSWILDTSETKTNICRCGRELQTGVFYGILKDSGIEKKWYG